MADGPELGRLGRSHLAVLGWLFDPTPQHWAVFTRMVLGSSLFVAWLFYLTTVQSLFGPEGIGGFATFERVPGAEITAPSFFYFRWLHGVRSAQLVWGLYVLMVCAALAFAVGIFTRTAGVILLVLHALFVGRNPVVFWGWASLIHVFLAYTLLSNPGRYLSVDAWRRRRREPADAAKGIGCGPAWPRRLVQVHVCTIYAIAGISRLDSPGWLDGSMVYTIYTNLLSGRMNIDWNPFIPLLRVGSYFAFVIEALAPLMLWIPRVGRWWALGLIAMHLLLELTTTVGWWSFLMIAADTSFLPVRWFQTLGAALRRLPLLGLERAGADG